LHICRSICRPRLR